MPTAHMAESEQPSTETAPRDAGAPVPKDAIDPELVRLRRPPARIGFLTSAGMVFLCAFFLWKLAPDRRFGGEADKPTPATVADILAGKHDADAFVAVPAAPMRSHAIRMNKNKGEVGLRVTPVGGSSERLWLVLEGTGWDPPAEGPYVGRLRRIADLPFGDTLRDHAGTSPRPMFAPAAALRAGFGTNTIKTVDGDTVKVRAGDRVVFDVIDPALSTIIATFTPGTPEHAPLLDAKAWTAELARLGITGTPRTSDDRDKSLGQVRFDVAMPVAEVTAKLEGAKLWAARVEPVTRRHETTWGALEGSSASGFTAGATVIPDAQIDLVGVYVARAIPDDAYALITGERPQDYWYILPITIVVLLIGLLFAWALIRTIRRDLLPAKA